MTLVSDVGPIVFSHASEIFDLVIIMPTDHNITRQEMYT